MVCFRRERWTEEAAGAAEIERRGGAPRPAEWGGGVGEKVHTASTVARRLRRPADVVDCCDEQPPASPLDGGSPRTRTGACGYEGVSVAVRCIRMKKRTTPLCRQKNERQWFYRSSARVPRVSRWDAPSSCGWLARSKFPWNLELRIQDHAPYQRITTAGTCTSI